MARVLLQNVLVLVNKLHCDQKLPGFDRLFVCLDDELGAVATRLLQLLLFYCEVLNDVEDVRQLAELGQLDAAELQV